MERNSLKNLGHTLWRTILTVSLIITAKLERSGLPNTTPIGDQSARCQIREQVMWNPIEWILLVVEVVDFLDEEMASWVRMR